MPLGSSAHIDFQLRHAGELVVYGAQKGYGLLDSPALEQFDQTQFRFKGYARVLVIREGAFDGLTQDTEIRHAGIVYTIRDIGNAGTDGLRRVLVSLGAYAAVARITITPTSGTLFGPTTQQLTATLFDAANNELTGRSIAWSSSDATIATVDQNGLVTGVGTGSAVITATAEGKSGTASFAVEYGSDADVIGTAAAVAVPVLSGWDLLVHSTLTLDGTNQVTEAKDVRGGAYPSLFGVSDGGGIWAPLYDPVTGSASTNRPGPSTFVTPWNGYAGYDLSTDITIVWLGAITSVSAGTYVMGMQLAANPNIAAQLQGNFETPQTLDAFLDTDGGAHSYHFKTRLTPSATPRLMIFCAPQPTGADLVSGLDLQATAMATFESPGRPREMLLQLSPNSNTWTRFPSGPARLFLGARTSGTNSVGTAVTTTYGGWVFGAKNLPRLLVAALERWEIAHGVTPDVTITQEIDGVGDSLTWGNGVADPTVDSWPAQMQVLVPSTVRVLNRGVSGDGFANAASDNVREPRLGLDDDAYRTGRDSAFLWLGPNSFDAGMSAATALNYVRTMAATARADNKKIAVAQCITKAGGIAQQAAYNTGLDGLKTEGVIDDVSRLAEDPRLQNPADTTYFYTDQEHLNRAGYGVVAAINYATWQRMMAA